MEGEKDSERERATRNTQSKFAEQFSAWAFVQNARPPAPSTKVHAMNCEGEVPKKSSAVGNFQFKEKILPSRANPFATIARVILPWSQKALRASSFSDRI